MAGRLTQADGFLSRALSLREALVTSHPDDATYQQSLAVVCNNLGALARDRGQGALAEEFHGRALAIRKRLAEQLPDDSDRQLALSDSYNNLGTVYRELSQPKQAEEAYKEALAIRRRLVESKPKDPQIRDRLAGSYSVLGVFFWRTNQLSAAAEHCAQAVAVGEELVKEHGSVTQYQITLANSLLNLGNVRKDQNRLPDAEETYRNALELRTRLATTYPTVASFRADHATVLSNLGVTCLDQDSKRWPEAKDHHERALAIRREILKMQPDSPDAKSAVAASLNNLANTLVAADAPEAAEDLFLESLNLKQTLAQNQPRNMDLLADVGIAHVNLGRLYNIQGHPEPALSQLAEAEKTLNQVLAVEPKQAAATRQLPKVLYQRAEALTALRRYDEALAAWDREFTLLLPIDNDSMLKRARVLALVGRHADAVAAVQKLSWSFTAQEVQQRTAAVFAIAAAAAERDSVQSQEMRREMAERYRTEAISRLSKLHDAGYFRDPALRSRLKKDPDFESLQSLPDFRKLLQAADGVSD